MTAPTVGSSSSAPRAAVQVDRGDLDEVQRAARLLLAHPLVTEAAPEPGGLALVRRWEAVPGNKMSRVLGFRLDVGRSCARLYRRSAALSVHRGPTLATGRPLGRGAARCCASPWPPSRPSASRRRSRPWPTRCCGCAPATMSCRSTSPSTTSAGPWPTRCGGWRSGAW